MVEYPANLSNWSKVSMLAKCMLANPAAGHHLCWQEILRLVRSCIQRWLHGDLVALWSEAVAEGQSLCRLVSKCIATFVHLPSCSLLVPLQLGVSVCGGCESIVHATSQLMSSFPDEEYWTLLLDFTQMPSITSAMRPCLWSSAATFLASLLG